MFIKYSKIRLRYIFLILKNPVESCSGNQTHEYLHFIYDFNRVLRSIFFVNLNNAVIYTSSPNQRKVQDIRKFQHITPRGAQKKGRKKSSSRRCAVGN